MIDRDKLAKLLAKHPLVIAKRAFRRSHRNPPPAALPPA
jgi:hypothetical protein